MGERVQKSGGVYGRRFSQGSGEKQKPEKPTGVKRITQEFYRVGQDGARIKNESKKAAELLEFIRSRMKEHEKRMSRPMSEKEIRAYGFDLAELEQGRIRPAKVE